MTLRFLVAGAVAVVVATVGSAPVSADPESPPAPTIPNVNAFAPVNPAGYATNKGRWFAFAGRPGVICVIDNVSADYGCSGSLPGAPDGANLVGGGPTGAPRFSTTSEPSLFAGPAGAVKSLPPNTRLSFRDISCGVDGAGVIACLNSRDQVGFVIGPTATAIDATNPLLDRPAGTPLLPGLPPVFPVMPPGQ